MRLDATEPNHTSVNVFLEQLLSGSASEKCMQDVKATGVCRSELCGDQMSYRTVSILLNSAASAFVIMFSQPDVCRG